MQRLTLLALVISRGACDCSVAGFTGLLFNGESTFYTCFGPGVSGAVLNYTLSNPDGSTFSLFTAGDSQCDGMRTTARVL